MRDDTSKGTDDEPSGRHLPAAVLGELAALRHSVTELGASPATMSPSHADQLASVLAVLGLATGGKRRNERDSSSARAGNAGEAAIVVTTRGGGAQRVARRAQSPPR